MDESFRIYVADRDNHRVQIFQATYTDDTPDSHSIGGTLSGLAGSGLVLQNNGGDDLAVTGNGGFTFATALDDGSAYAVTVKTQPSDPNQTCTVSNGSGTLAGANVTNVMVSCVTETYTVGGTVSGLAGTGLVLQNNGGDDLAIPTNGGFTFATRLAGRQRLRGHGQDATVRSQSDLHRVQWQRHHGGCQRV
ncbi:MAG: hypothetical protein GWM87_00200 [Xanthomonadales bacterium]|nr:hypothetical protein [Xanthomonadales bacterium]NIX11533.1 hypothetical protein [Xanthomonadales bacterium]